MKNRVIKFRVWDTEFKQWVWNISMGPNNVLCDYTDKGRLIVQQFTGLLDKDGKEIYEGDILCDAIYQNYSWRGVVKFSKGIFGLEWLSNKEHRRLDDNILPMLFIIGNVFENPELMKH